MADTFFVGQTGDPLQVAAVSLTNLIFILFMEFANMFGMGGSAAASIAGLNGVIYGQALTDIISVLLSIVLWIRCRKWIEAQE